MRVTGCAALTVPTVWLPKARESGVTVAWGPAGLPVPDKFVSFRRTHVFPNGDLLAIYEAPGHWPYAYGLVKLDKDSKVLWRYADLANHDLEVADAEVGDVVQSVVDERMTNPGG